MINVDEIVHNEIIYHLGNYNNCIINNNWEILKNAIVSKFKFLMKLCAMR
jgi:hypothetical protein